MKKRTVILGSAILAIVLIAGAATAAIWNRGGAGSGGNANIAYDLALSTDGVNYVQTTADAPLIITPKDPLSPTIDSVWVVDVHSLEAATAGYRVQVFDPSPNAFIKYKLAPNNSQIFPDVFTQIQFTVTDLTSGQVLIDHVTSGADPTTLLDLMPDGMAGQMTAGIAGKNAAPHQLEIRARLNVPGAADDISVLAPYSGASTSIGIRVTGESA